MKKTILALTIAAFVSPAFAADNENKNETTVDHSKNPITGTETTTKKTKMKKKGDHAKSEAEVTEKTKVKRDGTVEKSKEVESDSHSKTH